MITPKDGWSGNELTETAKADGPDAGKPARRKGQHECPKCGVENNVRAKYCQACGHMFGALNLSPPRPLSEAPPGLKCVQHPDVDAVARCRGCSLGVCTTCDFQLPGGLHFCPACIENAGNEEVSPKRRQRAIAALAVAVYGTLIGVFVFSGALYAAMGEYSNQQEFGLFVMYLVYVPSLIGTALSFSVFERRLRNTPLIWTALVWNCVLTGLFLLIEISGRLFL